MKKFIVYDVSGKILRTGVCPDDMLHIQARDGESVVEGEADDIRHKVTAGRVVDRPMAEIENDRKPERLKPVNRNEALETRVAELERLVSRLNTTGDV
jgi:hypothetical protein